MGSKQWIGAIELGYILDTLLGVSCKVITVSSGADMPSKAREIAHHFDTQVLQSPHAPMLTWALQPACGSRSAKTKTLWVWVLADTTDFECHG